VFSSHFVSFKLLFPKLVRRKVVFILDSEHLVFCSQPVLLSSSDFFSQLADLSLHLPLLSMILLEFFFCLSQSSEGHFIFILKRLVSRVKSAKLGFEAFTFNKPNLIVTTGQFVPLL